MHIKKLSLTSLATVGACVLGVALWAGGQGVKQGAAPISTAFTYQGRLDHDLSGGPVTSDCDFEFSLWDDPGSAVPPDPPTGGNQLGVTQMMTEPVTVGLFTVELNANGEFGPNPFDGNARWLQIAVRCPTGGGPFTPLSPRQEITPAPQSMYTVTAGNAIDADHALDADNALFADEAPWTGLQNVPPGFADGVDDASGDPVGTVVAWLKTFPGMPPLVNEWVECNGQVLNDPESDFDGLPMPNLNGFGVKKRFLRGSTSSGTTGGSESHSHGSTCAEFQCGNNAASVQGASHIPPFYEVVWIMKVK